MKIDVLTAAEFLLQHDNFRIFSHASPDGDTMGSSFALCRALQLIGKNAEIVCADAFSKNMAYMLPHINKQDFIAETFVSVDVADKKLLGCYENDAEKIQLAIDHHISHVDFAEKILLDSTAAACCEIIFRVITAMGVEIDNQIAACLYTGIATDTGCFRYANTTSDTHVIAAQLMKYQFNIADINYVLFDMKSRTRLKVEQQVLNGMEFFCGGKCAIAVMTAEMLDGIDVEDTNGISAMPRQIEGVEVGVVIKQKNSSWKVSMRSAHSANVQKICSIFGGGGHIKAAGCSIEGDIDDVKKQIAAAVEKELIEIGEI